MIQFEQVTRTYDELTAVDGVSFEIGDGEIVGLLGHNGAGKTTIMKMMAGFLEPSAGRIVVNGLDVVAERRAVQREIGYLPENCPLYPEMTVIDYLACRATLQREMSAEQQTTAVREAIVRTALEPKATAPIATLSRGYRQRVGVAQALLHKPRLLILDEPTNGLDPTQILHMRDLIRELARDATVLISTHILQEVRAVCDRAIILRSGKLAFDARLNALGAGGRLLATIGGEPQRILALLRGIDAVASAERMEEAEVDARRRRYVLVAADDDSDAAAAAVARALARADIDLYALHPQQRDLETLFGEIAAGAAQEPSHA